MAARYDRRGFSLIELLAALAVAGVLASAAVPGLSGFVSRLRVQAVLARLTVDLYGARMLAMREGARVQVRLVPRSGCALAWTVSRARPEVVLRTVEVRSIAPGVCLSDNVERALSIDSRGLLVGSPRTVHARSGGAADSLIISIAGRVFRSR